MQQKIFLTGKTRLRSLPETSQKNKNNMKQEQKKRGKKKEKKEKWKPGK